MKEWVGKGLGQCIDVEREGKRVCLSVRCGKKREWVWEWLVLVKVVERDGK